MQSKRHLIIIPIVLTRADWGSLESKALVDQEYETMATQYWQAVSEYVQRLPGDFSELRVYQDGLPDISTKIVTKIVEETQTANYKLLRWLRNKGALIMGTESRPLLLQGKAALETFLNAPEEQKHAALLEYRKVSACLLEGRDKYIAQRIKATLPEGGIGILFLGLAHEVKRSLEQEMEVSEPGARMDSIVEAFRKRLFGKEREW